MRSIRSLVITAALLGGTSLAQGSVATAEQLRGTFDRQVAPKLDGTSGLTLEGLTTLVTRWVQDVRRAQVTTLEPEVTQGLNAVNRRVQREASHLTDRCVPGPGARIGWEALDMNAFTFRPGQVGDFTPLHDAMRRCLNFEVVLESELHLQHPDMDVVIDTGVFAKVPVQVDLKTGRGSGQGSLMHARTDWNFLNGCGVAQMIKTDGLLRVNDLTAFYDDGRLGELSSGYLFEYRVSAPNLSVWVACKGAVAHVPTTPDGYWGFGYSLAHRSEASPSGFYQTPPGSAANAQGAWVAGWEWKQPIPGMEAGSEVTTLRVRHTPR